MSVCAMSVHSHREAIIFKLMYRHLTQESSLPCLMTKVCRCRKLDTMFYIRIYLWGLEYNCINTCFMMILSCAFSNARQSCASLPGINFSAWKKGKKNQG